jgi:hypothetical protein
VRNRNLLKSRVSEIRVKGIRVNQGVGVYPTFFSWELNIPKLMVVEEVGGANSHGFLLTSFLYFFIWVREDEIFVNFKLGNNKDVS